MPRPRPAGRPRHRRRPPRPRPTRGPRSGWFPPPESLPPRRRRSQQRPYRRLVVARRSFPEDRWSHPEKRWPKGPGVPGRGSPPSYPAHPSATRGQWPRPQRPCQPSDQGPQGRRTPSRRSSSYWTRCRRPARGTRSVDSGSSGEPPAHHGRSPSRRAVRRHPASGQSRWTSVAMDTRPAPNRTRRPMPGDTNHRDL